MQVVQWKRFGKGEWKSVSEKDSQDTFDLVLCFGDKQGLLDASIYKELKALSNAPHIVSCSTSGEILGMEVYDHELVATGIKFAKSEIKSASLFSKDFNDSFELGAALASEINFDDLQSVLVFSDGQLVNGSKLVLGMKSILGAQILITGGLAGDDANFTETAVGLNGEAASGQVCVVGLYGSQLKVNSGSKGGWTHFGPERTVTRSEANVLYELDGESALNLYKNYLGERAKDLPGSALLFPLSIKAEGKEDALVRTILSVNEVAQSMTFAGDIPEGSRAKLMKANFDYLVDGASEAAQDAQLSLSDRDGDQLALLVSCVGRKLVMGPRVEEEVEAVAEVMGEQIHITGFYSYGEICPASKDNFAELHNQTMTITTIAEV